MVFSLLSDTILFPTGNVTTDGFTGCSFENDTCNWQDVSTSQFQWLRARNATPSENTGPSVDNTLGTQLGESVRIVSTIILYPKSHRKK